MTSASDASAYEFKPGPLSSHGRILGIAGGWPRDARILEIGTASGYIGRELRARGFAHLIGVEIDPAAAAAARPFYERHEVRDIERDGLAGLGEFDVVICADVLEHLRDPAGQLAAVVGLVRPGGVVVVSLPNAVNWIARLQVLAGRFEYADRGLFDRGHLRFFTRRTARRLMEQAGLSVERIVATPLPVELVIEGWLPAVAARGLERAYTALAAGWGTLLAYQFVLVGRRGGAPGAARRAVFRT